MSVETAVFLAGNVAEAILVVLLIYRRVWRSFPFFFIYSLECLAGSVLYFFVLRYWAQQALHTYFYESVLDGALQFCVLVELTWSIFRPYRKTLPPATAFLLGVLIAIAGMAIWPFAGASAFAHLPHQWQLLGRLQQTDSILRVLFFLALAGCSQLLSIGWKDRELQVATGLGFYSLVSLTATMVHSHQVAGPQYRMVDYFVLGANLCSLIYWSFSFAHSDAKRREFSPQMQSVLLAVAGAARSMRLAASDSVSSGRKDNRP
ncbi:MAG TPA: hypothetical protein VMD55_05735 [Terracidiphilus sp.]|nr:hypothetical protein [Terracidiphilus sp.]